MTYEKKYSHGIWWIKRDLRLLDNPALDEAMICCEQVLPVFVVEPEWLNDVYTSALHTHAVFQALADLRKRLHKRGAPLLILQGRLPDLWQHLQDRWPFEALFSHQETGSSWSFARDKEVKRWCQQQSVYWHEPLQTGVFRGTSSRRSAR